MRKITIIAILLIIVVAGFWVAFWPKEETLQTKIYVKDTGLTDRNFTEYVTTFPGKRVFFFCSYKDDSCNYVNNTILKALAENLLLEELDNIIYVDLTKASPTALAKFKRQWGFTQYPAFAIIESTTEGYRVISALGFSQDKPFDANDVKNWLLENGIWHVWLGLEPPPPRPEPKPVPQPNPFDTDDTPPPVTTKPETKPKPPEPDPDPDPGPDPDPDPDPGIE